MSKQMMLRTKIHTTPNNITEYTDDDDDNEDDGGCGLITINNNKESVAS